jgi:hypothetical protein
MLVRVRRSQKPADFVLFAPALAQRRAGGRPALTPLTFLPT